MGIDPDDSDFADSIFVPFYIGSRSIRILVGGPRESLREFILAASNFQHSARSEEEVQKKVFKLAEQLGLTVGEILTAASPSGRFDTTELVLRAAQRPTAEQAWARVMAVLTSASEIELNELMVPANLSRVRPLIQSILRDLDELRQSSEAELRRELPPHLLYLLLD